MSVDYITIKKKRSKIIENDDGHDFPSMSVNLLQQINIKVAIFLFILGLFLFSDIFIKTILSTFSNTIDGIDYPNTKGTIIQLVFLVIAYIIIDLLVQNKCI